MPGRVARSTSDGPACRPARRLSRRRGRAPGSARALVCAPRPAPAAAPGRAGRRSNPWPRPGAARARWPRRAGTPPSPTATLPPIGPVAVATAPSRRASGHRAAHTASVQARGKTSHVSQGRSAGWNVSSGSPSPRLVSTSAAQCEASSATTPASRRAEQGRPYLCTP